jgi:hypothetical protein
MQRPIQRAFLVTVVVFSAFACLATPWVVAQELTPASDTHVFAGTSSTHSQLRKFETRLGLQQHQTTSEQSGSITPILKWPHTPIIEWPQYADH